MQANLLTRLIAAVAARMFGFSSGVIRNARTFHPDGRTFLGAVRSLEPTDPSLARASNRLVGAVLMRIGMGLVKKGMPRWLARWIPDAPSIATRLYSESKPGEIRLQRLEGEDVDILFTAGGDRLGKLIWNLATGGRMYGLHKYDYFRNYYYADVQYRIDDGKMDVWLRVAPVADDVVPEGPKDDEGREHGLTNAVARHARVRIEAQRVDASGAPFVPITEISFKEEIEIDQEALHFDPLSGRGFEPHGFLTALRKSVYPASARERPASRSERSIREREGIGGRLCRYLSSDPSATRNGCGKGVCAFFLLVALLVGLYAAWRFLPDQAVEYDTNEDHFKYGSLAGERNLGFPFWIWQAAPLVCSDTLDRIAHDRLPKDFLQQVANYKTSADGQPEVDRLKLSQEAYHQAFGMIYEPGAREKNLPV